MVENLISRSLQYYLSAKRSFDEGDFARALSYIENFDSLKSAHSKFEEGSAFSWRKHVVCIVAYKQLPATEALLKNIASLVERTDFCIVLVSNSATNVFPYAAELTGGRFASVLAGANFGASIGRNLAIHFAQSETITFLDDDGITSADSIVALVEALEKHDAAAVRGRVLPLENLEAFPKHYDLGNVVKQRFIDIEGITTWKTAALKTDRFDPLLYGHEGVELTARLYKKYGPDAFLYEPRAILRHDFVKPASVPADKLERMKKNNEYLEFKDNHISAIKSVFYGLDNSTQSARSLSYRRQIVSKKATTRQKTVSFVTTCLDAAEHLPDYCDSLERQSNQNFEILFIDDGSMDGSAEIVSDRFRGDSRFRLIRSDHVGRAAALNIALSHVQTELVLIADADDISVPQRVEWAQRAFEIYDTAHIIGFTIFDTKTPARGSRPLVSRPTPISVRRFFGMPCPFPGVSFRASAFSLPFDEGLTAGIDCDWLHRNIELNGLTGWYLPVPVSFYRTHDGQITTKRRDIQRSVSLACVKKLHTKYLHSFEPEDQEGLELFTGWRPVNNGASWHKMKNYGNKLISALDIELVPDAEFIVDEIVRHLEERHLQLSSLDYNRLKARTDQAKGSSPGADTSSNRVGELHSKLEWNRKRVKELEAELARRPTAQRFAELESKLLWNRSRLKELESGQRAYSGRWRILR